MVGATLTVWAAFYSRWLPADRHTPARKGSSNASPRRRQKLPRSEKIRRNGSTTRSKARFNAIRRIAIHPRKVSPMRSVNRTIQREPRQSTIQASIKLCRKRAFQPISSPATWSIAKDSSPLTEPRLPCRRKAVPRPPGACSSTPRVHTRRLRRALSSASSQRPSRSVRRENLPGFSLLLHRESQSTPRVLQCCRSRDRRASELRPPRRSTMPSANGTSCHSSRIRELPRRSRKEGHPQLRAKHSRSGARSALAK